MTMKVLLDHPLPFSLVHGGFSIQLEQTRLALERAGLEVGYLQWWVERQPADVIHYFGRPTPSYIQAAHQKGIKVVLAELLTALGSRRWPARIVQKGLIIVAGSLLPASLTERQAWRSFRLADACVAGTEWEARLMSDIFGAPAGRVHVVPNGVEEIFFDAGSVARGEWLVCAATITERKRVLELAQACLLANIRLWVIGKPYFDSDPYAQAFFELARQQPASIRYEGPVTERKHLAQIYGQARGFVLLSTMETRSLSAEEAAACGCPLLLSDLPWARSVFGQHARYCPIASPKRMAPLLRQFYEDAPKLRSPQKPKSWNEVALQLKALYKNILGQREGADH